MLPYNVPCTGRSGLVLWGRPLPPKLGIPFVLSLLYGTKVYWDRLSTWMSSCGGFISLLLLADLLFHSPATTPPTARALPASLEQICVNQKTPVTATGWLNLISRGIASQSSITVPWIILRNVSPSAEHRGTSAAPWSHCWHRVLGLQLLQAHSPATPTYCNLPSLPRKHKSALDQASDEEKENAWKKKI